MEIKLNKISTYNLKDIDVNFKEGLINGILGNNGSGKTLLANVLGAISYPRKGNLKLDGVTIDVDNPMINYEMIRFEIGYVMQNPSYQLFCENVQEQILFMLNQFNYKNNKKRILDALRMVSLDDTYLNRSIEQLSDGEKFKVSLASVLALNPKILILDEPFSYLDFQGQQELIKLMILLKTRYHKTIIILSNNPNIIYENCDYIYILANNKIVSEGTKYEVFKDKKIINKYNIELPKIVLFQNKVMEKKNIKMGYRDNINDLLKDIYFYKN